MSERDGYEHGVPSWIDRRPRRPRRRRPPSTPSCSAGSAERRGELPRLHAARPRRRRRSSPRRRAAAWRTHVWVESADDAAAPRTRARAARCSPSRPTCPASAARPSLADPAGAVFTVAEPDARTAAPQRRQRAGRVGDEPALARPTPRRATPSTAPSSAGRPTVRRARVTLFRLPGLRRRRAVSSRSRATSSRVGQPRRGRRAGPSTSGSTTSTRPPRKAAELGGARVAPPFRHAVGRTAVLADPQGAHVRGQPAWCPR